MYPDEIVQEVTGSPEEQERIMQENLEAKLRHSARKEQEMLDKPFLYEIAIEKLKKLFGFKKKQNAVQNAAGQQHTK